MAKKKITVPYLSFRAGQNSGVPETGLALFRYNSVLNRVELSLNGAPYQGFAGPYDGYLFGEFLTAPNPEIKLDGYVAYIDDTSTELNKVTIQQIIDLVASGSSPGDPDGSIQFNSGGIFGGTADLVWSNSTKMLQITNSEDELELSGASVNSNNALDITANSVSIWRTLGGTSDLTISSGGSLYLKSDNEIKIGDDTLGVDITLAATSDISPALFVSGTTGYVGVGSTPTSRFSVALNKFQVNDNGDLIKIKDKYYSWPTSYGAAGSVLTNIDGYGELRWVTTGGVTSVTLNMGTTGLTVNSGTSATISSSGTFNINGVLALANGGTGQTTKPTAFAALSPLSNKGDILVFSTANTRLPVGDPGQVLTCDPLESSGIKWANAATGTVTGTGADNQIATWSSASSLDGSTGLTWNSATAAFAADGAAVFNGSKNNYDFRVAGDNEDNVLCVDASADAVGIGTNLPIATLHVVGGTTSHNFRVAKASSSTTLNSEAAGVVLANTDTTNNNYYTLTFASNNTSGGLVQGAALWGVFTAHGSSNISADLAFGTTDDSSGSTERMRITSTGNIGIGTSSPTSAFSVAEKFHVNALGDITKINNISYGFPDIQGTANTVLTNDGYGNLVWELPPGAVASPSITPIVTKNTTYTITLEDGTILADAALTAFSIILPAASSSQGYTFTIKKKDNSSNIVTIQRSGSDLIDGKTTYLLQTRHESIKVQSDGLGWWIV